jgi:15-cis-phytoene desaturase
MDRADVVVVGAGLAGLACAFELASAGREVLLLEGRPYLGGRTASWVEDGMPVESGLHRYLGFYDALTGLLQRAGVSVNDIIVWEDMVEIRTPNGPRGVFGVAPFYRPLTTLASLLGNNALLSPLDKLSLMPMLARGLLEYALRPERLDRRSALGYARANLATRRAQRRFVEPFSTGLFFLPPDRYSAYAFFMPFAYALRRLTRVRVGAFRGGMSEVMADPLAAAIARRGGVVQAGAPVKRLRIAGGRVTGVEIPGAAIEARHVVVATSLRPAQRLLAQFGRHPWARPMLSLPSMPVVTIQLELDRPSMPYDRTTFGPCTALASFAEQSRTTFRHVPGRLSVILGRPERFLEATPEEILAVTVRDAAKLGIDLDGHVLRYRVVTRPDDFYSLAPGKDHLRPGQVTPIPGLTLAGDYTRQPLLGTMEGAVISGQLAARAVLAARA